MIVVVDETYIVMVVSFIFKSNSENGISSFFDEVTDKNSFEPLMCYKMC